VDQTGQVQSTPVGHHALLVEVEDADAALSLATWARETSVEAVEVVPAAASVLFDGVADVPALARVLAGWSPSASPPAGELVEIGVRYDGPDLAAVAERWGVDVETAVERHASVEYVAAFCGFAPGFSYLRGLPEELAVPRLDSPRSRVPAGAVGLAGEWCGVYPRPSPGGWRILGTTDAVLWDQDREPPALLAPGTRVRFVAR
jgi:KipI family sensor histidine kinase inhibitor